MCIFFIWILSFYFSNGRGARAYRVPFVIPKKGGNAKTQGGVYMLTPKQEQYCKNRAILKMSQRKAYIDAFPSAKEWKLETVDTKGCNLEAEDTILARIKELQDEIKAEMMQQAEWTRKDALKELKSLIDRANREMDETNSMSGPNVSAIVNAVKELNSIYEVTAETTERESDGFIEALEGKAGEVWNDEETGDIPI
jgi:hypothetical protein